MTENEDIIIYIGDKYDLTLERLLVGIQKNAEERPWDCDLENYDATTCDCIIQYALYDEIIFG